MKAIKLMILFTLILTLTSFFINSNDAKIWTKQTNVQKAIDFEKSLTENIEFLNQNVALSKSIYPLIDKYQISKPIIIKRELKGELPVYAEYFFSLPDSTIRYIGYDWEIEKYGNYFNKLKIWKEESKKLNKYNSKYEQIKLFITNKLGKPIEEDIAPKKTKSNWDNEEYLTRNTVWENKEIYSSLNLIFASNTYRIRWNYYWKK